MGIMWRTLCARLRCWRPHLFNLPYDGDPLPAPSSLANHPAPPEDLNGIRCESAFVNMYGGYDRIRKQHSDKAVKDFKHPCGRILFVRKKHQLSKVLQELIDKVKRYNCSSPKQNMLYYKNRPDTVKSTRRFLCLSRFKAIFALYPPTLIFFPLRHFKPIYPFKAFWHLYLTACISAIFVSSNMIYIRINLFS